MRVRREHIRQVHELGKDFGQLVLSTIEGDRIRWHAGESKEENEIDPKRQFLLWRLKIEMSGEAGVGGQGRNKNYLFDT
jgi:hypothetical protein